MFKFHNFSTFYNCMKFTMLRKRFVDSFYLFISYMQGYQQRMRLSDDVKLIKCNNMMIKS